MISLPRRHSARLGLQEDLARAFLSAEFAFLESLARAGHPLQRARRPRTLDCLDDWVVKKEWSYQNSNYHSGSVSETHPREWLSGGHKLQNQYSSK